MDPDRLQDAAVPVRAGEEIDAAKLTAFLNHHIPDLGREITIRQFPSGFSNLTYLLETRAGDLVLRRPPIGAKVDKGHDMGREFKVLQAVNAVFSRCPKPLAFCEDAAVIGAPFFVMEKASGLILRRDLPPDLAFSSQAAGNLCQAMVETLAEIHGVDVAELGFIGKPEGYVKRQVEGWSARYRKARTPDAPDFEEAMAWLAEHMPPDTDRPGLVHNDYKFDNLVLTPEPPHAITHVLDWEMATIGDPLMDLGNSLAYWVQADDPETAQVLRTLPTHLPGMYTRRQVVAAYGKARGCPVENFEFYYGFGLFRLAVIAQQIYYRFYHKITDNPRFAFLIAGVTGLEKQIHQLIQTSQW